jgi:hypothetical protein
MSDLMKSICSAMIQDISKKTDFIIREAAYKRIGEEIGTGELAKRMEAMNDGYKTTFILDEIPLIDIYPTEYETNSTGHGYVFLANVRFREL